MCGRFNFLTHKTAVEERYGVSDIDFEIVPRYNIAPSQKIAAVIQDPNLRLVEMRWGYIPVWAKEEKIGYKMINSRAEKIAKSRVFKSSFQKKRCLIPATGFYEWQKVGKVKKPMHIRLESRDIFSFAGGKSFELISFILARRKVKDVSMHSTPYLMLRDKLMDEASAKYLVGRVTSAIV